jgi:predicted Zn-dependent peptidase
MPASQTAAVGLWSTVGARHEPAKVNGISHFLEHLLFKGTRKRSARRISEEVEGVGGDLNAYTAEERTCYYAAASAEHLERVTDVLSDMYRNSRLETAEIERERGVIAEEIEMIRDEPAQHVQELLTAETWSGCSLARPITGTKTSLGSITRKDLKNHLADHYHARGTLLTAAGAVDHDRFVAMAENLLGSLPEGRAPKTPAAPKRQGVPRVVVESRDTQQTQMALSFRCPGAIDPRRHAVNLLHVLLGGNMSSRLFQELRERRGLCYSVSTAVSAHSDCGAFEIALGLEGEKVEKALGLILRECTRIVEKGPSKAELRRACDYSIGTSRMALERASTQNYRLGSALMTYGKIVPPEQIYDRLAQVTPEEIRKVASLVLNHRTLCLAMVGPGPTRGRLMEKIRGK